MRQLVLLNQAYTGQDIAYTQTPAAFQAWLRDLDVRDEGRPHAVAKIAARLLMMTMPQRRQTSLAMMRHDFWTPLTRDFLERTALREAMFEAVQQSLARAPVLGDLWLVAAKLDIEREGMTERALRFIKLSGTYAPKEGELVMARYVLMQQNFQLLDEDARQLLQRDFEHVIAAYPEKAAEINKEYLQLLEAPASGLGN